MIILNRVVLVTGASRGLGASIAKKFLDSGDIVYIHYNKHEDEAKKLASLYQNAFLVKADIHLEEEIKKMIQYIKTNHGHLDVLVNNAGVAIDTLWKEKTKENFNYILDVNLIAPFLISKYASDIMEEGSIINISSNTAIDAYYSYSLDYDASKAGLISLTHNLATIFAPKIRVNAVAPGWINTPMNQELDLEYIKEECEHILLNRFANPEEVANVVFFLASKEASYINNSVIRVDGGLK